ncbi:unnamed protein product [Phytophthora fragariaefolia]|uniref:Unnamed protein product n=1 Tax=Phytophthora fragariaefolia TaxID=1490495 RepID=A0A9W6Y0S8_9STRA|nr:unnamed protein product [Phytophthora fragariaefolia]
MLASMMYWTKLDGTSRAKCVPNSYFLQAEVILDAMTKKDTTPSKWPPLDDSTVELFSLSSDEHGDPQDQDYDDAAERAASAPVVQGDVTMLDVESDEDETIPPPRLPSTIKRARSSTDSSTGETATYLSKASSLPATAVQSQRVPPSKKRKSRADCRHLAFRNLASGGIPSTIQDGEPRTLAKQQEEVDEDEPGRNQWWSCMEEQRLAHIAANLKAKLVPAHERDLISAAGLGRDFVR